MKLTQVFQVLKKRFDRDLIFTGINQIWAAIIAPINLILISLFLSAEAQGYWYTMASLAALSVLADLGFTIIVLQFSAHEFAYLKFDESNLIAGDGEHLNRIATLLTFCVKWTFFLIIVAFPLIFTAGFVVLSSQPTLVEWITPWLIFLIASGIQFFNGILLAFFEGCNSVANIQKLKFFISLTNSLTLILFLILRFEIYALAVSSIVSASLGFFLILKKYYSTITDLIKISKKTQYSWKKEFFTLLWRYAISFGSGYFIFSIYTPIAFSFLGPVFAGKVGISMILWTSIFNVSNIWITAITPQLNINISKKDWRTTDNIFYQNLKYAILTFLLAVAGVFFVLIYLRTPLFFIVTRFLDVTPMIILAVIWFFQIFNNSLAVYLRAHKKEPLVVPSLLSGIFISIITILAAQYLPAEFFFLGFLLNVFWCSPWIITIFRKNKRAWHNE